MRSSSTREICRACQESQCGYNRQKGVLLLKLIHGTHFLNFRKICTSQITGCFRWRVALTSRNDTLSAMADIVKAIFKACVHIFNVEVSQRFLYVLNLASST